MHTKDFLAQELRAAGLNDMADRAATGYYHDFLSPLAAPCIQLMKDLEAVGSEGAIALMKRHANGEFDATNEEGDEWFEGPEGQEAVLAIISNNRTPNADT